MIYNQKTKKEFLKQAVKDLKNTDNPREILEAIGLEDMTKEKAIKFMNEELEEA